MGINKNWFRSIALAVLVFPGSLGIAQNNNQQNEFLELTLNKAIEIALSDNPMIRIADKEVQRVDYSRKETRSALIPSLTGEGMYTRNFNKPVIFMPEGLFGPGTGGAIEMGYDNSYTGTLSASLPLFSLSLYQNIKISEHDMALALESARASRVNMIAEVRKAYYTMLLANDSYQVMSKSVENANDNLRNVKNLFSQGMVAEYDVIRSEVQVRNLTPTLVQAENGVRLSEMMLRVLLGIDQKVTIKVTDALGQYHHDGLFAANADYNLTENTDLRQLDLQMERMQTQFKLVRSQRYPTLAAFSQYQFVSQANDFQFSNYKWAKPFIAGIQISIPIFRGGAINYQEKQVKIAREQISVQRDYLNRNLELQVRNAYTNMQKAFEQIESSKVGVNQAERGYSIAKTRYQTGSGTLLELNDSEIALTQAKLNLNQAMFDFLSAEADYFKIIGRSVDVK